MRFASVVGGLAASLFVVTAGIAAESATAQSARPTEPPRGASIPVPGPQLRLAKNGHGQVLAVHDIADPANPYVGQYSSSDRWNFEHYVAAVTPEEEKHFGG
jgi:hypothetical protein